MALCFKESMLCIRLRVCWRQQKTHDWLGEQAILAGKNKDVEERNNIIQSNIQSEAITGKGHSNAWPGTAS
jgi:hypothetical protein